MKCTWRSVKDEKSKHFYNGKILSFAENWRWKKTNKSVAEEYGVKKNAISAAVANKRKIIEAYESGQLNSSQEKLKKSDNNDLDEAVFTWFKNPQSSNIPANGIIIKKKALSLVKSLELTDFWATDGWLDK